MTTILFELLTEELPPKSLKSLQDSLACSVTDTLSALGVGYQGIKAFAAPRRLALMIKGIDDTQADKVEQKRGPAIKACYDKDGNPTKALQGFAQGLGVGVDELITISTDKGDYIGYNLTVQGQDSTTLLPNVLQKALDELPIAKRMRWGDNKEEFVRPVKSVVLMKNDTVIDATIQGKKTGNQTFGHRFHAPNAITIPHADDYENLLKDAYVLADFDKRKNYIKEQVNTLSDEQNAKAIMPEDLLDEVTALVDYPVVLKAGFDERFLEVPQEALISTMQADQKYFCLTDNDGNLLPNFIFVSNIDSKDENKVILGNEKVIRPRLSDAEFFFLQDQKQPLFAFTESLKGRIFQDKLGTLWEKSERIAKVSAFIAGKIGADISQATRAGILSKADLASTLVGEFPELQGIAGTYYARASGEEDAVCDAIFEQYLPKFSGDKLPATPIGICLALADRLDTLVGIFGIGQLPTGSKDPFSLRRAAIGLLRILIEKRLALNLVALVEQALLAYGNKIDNLAQTFTEVMAFISARYRAFYEEQGVSVDVILAVQAINPHMPLDFDDRVRAVQAFYALPIAKTLAQNNKRVANILAKSDNTADVVDSSLLTEPAEKTLYNALEHAKTVIAPLQKQADYQAILTNLAHLDEPLTTFFETVMVNSDDTALKNNRLALLKQVRTLFLTVADIGVLQG